ncbi:hypothetical protein BRSPCE3_00050 [Bradyrhizobium sp. Ce-3]|nr:hypothetical protein BRSPCE3_00050 [Bradyrhizobium sp. Ce-3]
MLSVRGLGNTCRHASRHPQLSRWIRPVLSSARRRFGPALRRHDPRRSPTGRVLRVMHSTPQNASRDTSRVRFFRGPFRPSVSGSFAARSVVPTAPKIRAAKPFTRGPKAWRSGHFGTLVGATGGDPNTLAPNRLKLGHVRCARQGLVRVSESNTKYGGGRGITGGNAAPVIAPTIGESSGIPKPKKFLVPVDWRFAPLFTGEVFIRRAGLNFGDSRRPTGNLRIRHVSAVMVGRQNHGQGVADSHRLHALAGFHDRS